MKTKLLKNYRFRTTEKIYRNSVLKDKVSVDKRKYFSIEDTTRIVVEGQSGEVTIQEICLRDAITPIRFYKKSNDFLKVSSENKIDIQPNRKSLSDDDRYRIVLEGNNGTYSIAEICKKENISHDKFLQWSDEFLQITNKRLDRERVNDYHTIKIKELIENLVGEDILAYFESFIDVTSKETMVIRNHHKCSRGRTFNNKSNLVCLSKINDIRNINKHFELVNSKLPQGGVFIGCLETLSARRNRINSNGIPVLSDLYLGSEFLFKRVLPKLDITKKHYFNITKGKGRLLSKAEGLGRLVSCGFKIMDFKNINGLTYFVVKKDKEPSFDQNPSYGPVYKMPRIGKDGKIIKVYKFRTMHPYSEYLQDYVLKSNGYAETGKPAEDFRIPQWGKFIRRFWFDEIPQLINVFKGEMKLVGIRPVSQRYFQDIPKEMKKLRLTQKPGCIPPYVALNRDGNVMSVLQSEKDYLEEKIRNPYSTDIKYFMKALFNILFLHKRSA